MARNFGKLLWQNYFRFPESEELNLIVQLQTLPFRFWFPLYNDVKSSTFYQTHSKTHTTLIVYRWSMKVQKGSLQHTEKLNAKQGGIARDDGKCCNNLRKYWGSQKIGCKRRILFWDSTFKKCRGRNTVTMSRGRTIKVKRWKLPPFFTLKFLFFRGNKVVKRRNPGIP